MSLDSMLIDTVQLMKLRSFANPTIPGTAPLRPPQDGGGGLKQEYDPLPTLIACNVQPEAANKTSTNARVGSDQRCSIYFDDDPGCNANDKFAWVLNDGASKADALGRLPEIVVEGPAVNQAGRGTWKVMGVIRAL